MNDAAINALIRELNEQRSLLGNRAAQLAASNAELAYQLEVAKKRIAELEQAKQKPDESSGNGQQQ